MKNNLEKRLETWTPRPPSARLEERLFGRRLQPAAGLLHWQHWLSSATAVLLLCALVAGTSQRDSSWWIKSPVHGLIATTLVSEANLSSAQLAAAQSRGGQNQWHQGSFEWTNLSHSLTTATPIHQTNGLLH